MARLNKVHVRYFHFHFKQTPTRLTGFVSVVHKPYVVRLKVGTGVEFKKSFFTF